MQKDQSRIKATVNNNWTNVRLGTTKTLIRPWLWWVNNNWTNVRLGTTKTLIRPWLWWVNNNWTNVRLGTTKTLIRPGLWWVNYNWTNVRLGTTKTLIRPGSWWVATDGHRWPGTILALLFRSFGFLAPKALTYLAFRSLDFERTWWSVDYIMYLRFYYYFLFQ